MQFASETAAMPAFVRRLESVVVTAASPVEKPAAYSGDRLEVPHRLVVITRTGVFSQRTDRCNSSNTATVHLQEQGYCV